MLRILTGLLLLYLIVSQQSSLLPQRYGVIFERTKAESSDCHSVHSVAKLLSLLYQAWASFEMLTAALDWFHIVMWMWIPNACCHRQCCWAGHRSLLPPAPDHNSRVQWRQSNDKQVSIEHCLYNDQSFGSIARATTLALTQQFTFLTLTWLSTCGQTLNIEC